MTGLSRSRVLLPLLALSFLLTETRVAAQGFGANPTPGMSQPPREPEKPAGPAEAAPKEEQDLEPALPTLPEWPGQERKKLQFLELHGYFRLRADLFQNLNLSQTDAVLPLGATLRAPFWRPLSENPASSFTCAARTTRGLTTDGCPANAVAGADMRLRLEPTINVSERVRVMAQVDLLDNLQLGSTPGSLAAGAADLPAAVLSDSQAAPIAGLNTNVPAVLVKRAWSEVETPVGTIHFGRMPWHWGLGLYANDGQCRDCDTGDNQDRLMFSTELYGYALGLGWDFAASGPNTLSIASGRQHPTGRSIDLEQLDDVGQFFFYAGRMEPPDTIQEKVALGELVINYGLYFLYRSQGFGYVNESAVGVSEADAARGLLSRQGWVTLPDVWFKILYNKLYLEFEGLLAGGKIDNVSGLDQLAPRDILQFGFVLRSHYLFLRDTLKVGFEVGMASGDDSELFDLNRQRGQLVNQTVSDRAFNEMRLDSSYLVDLILFRQIMGSVANAVYFKPSIQYEFLEALGARLDLIYSLAPKPIAYPGNSPHLGIELDTSVYYKNDNEGFSAGAQFGTLFPLAGLDRPADLWGAGLAQDAKIGLTLQGWMHVKF